jgi:Tol biopolymer transport system component
VALNISDSPDRGHVEVSPVGTEPRWTMTDLQCERVYFAAGTGICLAREFKFLAVRTVATLLDGDFKPRASLRTDGIPSRARVSPDGRVAAFTVFVTGHSYGDAQMSTATFLLDAGSGATIANLEEFTVVRDGQTMASPDFNFWGVTFQHDSNFFYATLRTGKETYLVHGDTRAKTATIVHADVECPSLSPDETRVAFKKRIGANEWRLNVLDLTTGRETALAETRSVDDQAEWLDDGRLLYGIADQPPWMSIMVVPADGRGEAALYAKGAASPSVW